MMATAESSDIGNSVFLKASRARIEDTEGTGVPSVSVFSEQHTEPNQKVAEEYSLAPRIAEQLGAEPITANEASDRGEISGVGRRMLNHLNMTGGGGRTPDFSVQVDILMETLQGMVDNQPALAEQSFNNLQRRLSDLARQMGYESPDVLARRKQLEALAGSFKGADWDRIFKDVRKGR